MPTSAAVLAAASSPMLVSFDIGGWPATRRDGWVHLYLDPTGDTPRVYTHGGVGTPTCPMAAFNGLHRSLGKVEPQAHPEGLLAYLMGCSAQIADIAAGYLGSRWNGSNHVGEWASPAVELAEEFSQQLVDAFTKEIIACTWDAVDYLANTKADVLDGALQSDTIEDAAIELVDEALEHGAVLDQVEVETVLRTWIEERAQKLEDNIREPAAELVLCKRLLGGSQVTIADLTKGEE